MTNCNDLQITQTEKCGEHRPERCRLERSEDPMSHNSIADDKHSTVLRPDMEHDRHISRFPRRNNVPDGHVQLFTATHITNTNDANPDGPHVMANQKGVGQNSYTKHELPGSLCVKANKDWVFQGWRKKLEVETKIGHRVAPSRAEMNPLHRLVQSHLHNRKKNPVNPLCHELRPQPQVPFPRLITGDNRHPTRTDVHMTSIRPCKHIGCCIPAASSTPCASFKACIG